MRVRHALYKGWKTGRWILLVTAGLLLVVWVGLNQRYSMLSDYPLPPSQPVSERLAGQFMVSAPHPLAVEAGMAVLSEGGNAMDAAVAVQMVLTLVEAPETGIGGGGFLLYRDGQTGRVHFYDGRETAPASAESDRFLILGRPMPLWAAVPMGRSVGVPGLVAMLWLAHAQHGSKDWSTLLEPAITLSEQGVPMSTRLQRQLAEDLSLRLSTDLRRYFYRQARSEPPMLHNPELATTLRLLADQGPKAFYQGPLAQAIVERAASGFLMGSDLQISDLATYQAIEREPVCGRYHEWTICGAPPPSSGGIAVLQILGMLAHFPLAELGPDSPISWHLIAEASRLAFADRNHYVGDPDFVQVPVAALIDPDYLAARAALIDPNRAMSYVPVGQPEIRKAVSSLTLQAEPGRTGTSHFSIVDAQGNVVSLTSSIEMPFGSRRMVGGFLLNNQLTDFTFTPSIDGIPHPNAVAGGKRPRSSMSPIIVIGPEGETRLVIGSRGGSRIIGYVVKALIGVLDWEMDIQEAIALPNVVHRGDVLELERGSDIVIHREALEAMGHRVRETRMTSGLHGIERIGDRWRGGADPRLEGLVAGN